MKYHVTKLNSLFEVFDALKAGHYVIERGNFDDHRTAYRISDDGYLMKRGEHTNWKVTFENPNPHNHEVFIVADAKVERIEASQLIQGFYKITKH